MSAFSWWLLWTIGDSGGALTGLVAVVGVAAGIARFRWVYLVAAALWGLAAFANAGRGGSYWLTVFDSAIAAYSVWKWWSSGGGDDFRRGRRKAKRVLREVAGKLILVPAPAGAR